MIKAERQDLKPQVILTLPYEAAVVLLVLTGTIGGFNTEDNRLKSLAEDIYDEIYKLFPYQDGDQDTAELFNALHNTLVQSPRVD
jgi:hypothetical protein